MYIQQELEALVRSKVQCYMSVHQDDEIVKLRKKVADLQEANDKWKTQARELQKQVVDLTVLKQKLEKRKAATAALRVSKFRIVCGLVMSKTLLIHGKLSLRYGEDM